ncbi:hypothetical protein PFF91_07330 [Burkholderia cenocepacia]|uniref:hypothetical protein n=1 Tax=Burkholderia cenocepacia TaxID=95486 RepID=UPI00078DD00B|nr:hypothetical protein [Burkholderia cenocepacia]AMU06259.1 hypothetical protein A2T82_08175 [Burkholderia cenocepacia]MBJ9697397.1 hypothetical protein [Burkholderia cenocepacia]MBO1854517.1 hypothetical protein [Burkholderia cenocepacia]MBR7937939.1 hypothetical protein [Burkholderia cenocepacia]MBR7946187.1 hypothetical protein [Burkholderia cenocepacia]
MLRIQYHFAWESIMKKIAAVCVLAGSLAVAGPASAHGRDGGAVIGALIGGAVLGAIVTSAMNPPVAYQAPVYQAPAYQPPTYYQAPAYQQPAYPTYQQAQYQDDGPNYCYDRYQRAYVCGAPVQQGGYVQPAGW